MNTKAIADAIAGRFAGITIVDVGVTVSLGFGPTASLPNSIAKGPALLVFHPRGVLDIQAMRTRNDQLDFPVRLLTDPLNYPQRSDALYAWYDVMRDRVEMNMDLDLAYVAWAKCVSMRAALDAVEYAGITYDLVELIVRVHLRETVATVSI